LKAMVILKFVVGSQSSLLYYLWNVRLTLQHALGSRHNSSGALKRWGSKEAIYSFHGSICLQEGDTAESFKVL